MNNTVTKQVDRTDREQYLEACRSYAAATSPMDGLALAQLAIAAIFAGMQIGEQNAMTAQMSARDLQDESTAELEKSIAEIDAINMKIRDNLNKEHAEEEAKNYRQDYEALTAQIHAPLLKEWSDITLFLAFQTHVIATDDKGKKHKATACNRVMYTTKTAWWDAKNRFGLPEMLPLEYASIAPVFAAPAPAAAPVPKAQQVIEKAKAAGLPTEKDLAESELLISSGDQFPEPQQTPIEVQTQHILDGIAPQLAQLMAAAQVQPSELQAVVGSKGYFPADMPVQNYPQDFVEDWCIPWWQNILEMIQQNRK